MADEKKEPFSWLNHHLFDPDRDYDYNKTLQFPTMGVTGEQVNKFVTYKKYEEKPFVEVVPEFIEENKDLLEGQKEDLYKLVGVTAERGSINQTWRQVQNSHEFIKPLRPAFNNKKFWNCALLIIGVGIIGIIVSALFLSIFEKPIPDFFGTSIGALIGVLGGLFAGWTQLR